MKRKWRYADHERPKAVCYDCGLAYEAFPVEMVIAHETWEAINPTNHEGAGLLCHNCMIDRLRECNITIVDVLFFGVMPETECATDE